ncbi:RNA-guided endonuclease InsQ/TnpB family protein [Streptomyces mirabilis]|uniref:RNA-guided endonuclease InsQ/TnpB family protein n=1 Tax=Streptomyces mirabilis TaxID=68239 RepID=UPI0036A83222
MDHVSTVSDRFARFMAIRQARKDIDWLGILPAQAAQAVLKTYHRAWANYSEGRAGEPNFKARFRAPMAVDVPQGRDLSIARLVKDSLGWHLAFRVQTLEPKSEPRSGPEVGIDVGVRVPLALSDGGVRTHGAWLTGKEQIQLLKLERRAAHRKSFRSQGAKTSRRLGKTYGRIQALHARANRRHLDWQNKTTTELARTYGVMVVEDLTITNMTKSAKGSMDQPGRNVAQKSGLNRAIAQEAWGRTVVLLTRKAARLGGVVPKVPASGTSQGCSVCHVIMAGSRESQAVFVCKNSACGWIGNADHNAARNVLYRYRIGLALVPAAGRAVVRRARRVKPATAR